MTPKRKDIVERGKGPEQIRTIDKGIKNAWKWDWLEKDVDGVSLAENIRKLDRPGMAYCTVCQREINYGRRGLVALTDHCRVSKHRELIKLRKTNYRLQGEILNIFLQFGKETVNLFLALKAKAFLLLNDGLTKAWPELERIVISGNIIYMYMYMYL